MSRRFALLAALSGGALLASASSVGISPFLIDMARDLDTDLTAAGNLIAIQSVAWGVASLFAGASSDRLGRRPILVAGCLLLVISGFGVALAQTYAAVAIWRLISGVGGGAFMGTVFATVADHVPGAQRGRALGWVVTGQSFALVIGVPVMALAGAAVGWRGAVIGHSIAMLIGTVCVWLAVPRSVARASQPRLSLGAMRRLIGPRVLALLLAGTSRTCLLLGRRRVSADLPAHALSDRSARAGAGPLGCRAREHVRQSARWPAHRPCTRAASGGGQSLALSGLLAVPVLWWSPSFAVSVALGFAYTLANATGRPALLTLLSHVSVEARGAVLG